MHLYAATQDIVQSLRFFLENVEEEKYRQPVGALSNATLGQHVRHTIEFFQCLLEQSEGGVINYDKRLHSKLMEEQPAEAVKMLETILGSFKDVAEKPLILENSFSEKEDSYARIPTSFQREWTYALEHAIHHMAIIKIGVSIIAPGMKLHENFGVAPSTIKYRHRQCVQ